jgi:hypothetical protein
MFQVIQAATLPPDTDKDWWHMQKVVGCIAIVIGHIACSVLLSVSSSPWQPSNIFGDDMSVISYGTGQFHGK